MPMHDLPEHDLSDQWSPIDDFTAASLLLMRSMSGEVTIVASHALAVTVVFAAMRHPEWLQALHASFLSDAEMTPKERQIFEAQADYMALARFIPGDDDGSN